MKEKFIIQTIEQFKESINTWHRHGYSQNQVYYLTIGMVDGALRALNSIDTELFLEVIYSDLADPAIEYLESLYND